ncbi:unnamed protein product [Rotaria socialis]|uniref:Uncharacterized protein n=1 Tax=Rotaria socialis TaxID=392032 RepID=A0A820MLD0_9BILA|nr:unnamed protein product [Rotaria socialis]CAF3387026.1 unnamed protein product [Rotaria socialis]CAF3436488.1 unnamed protein product [Rotaria socialis]CAF3656805.1 unnamed protein product [Rotaria socialis]CAF4196298.1 unnamed protein product [Rotaria socialis]
MSENANNQALSIVWLDDSDENSQENMSIQQHLRALSSNFKMFKAINDCEQYLKNQPETTPISLIVSGRLGKDLVPVINSLPQIIVIYIYCYNVQEHKLWAVEYDKVKGVHAIFDEIKIQLGKSQTIKKQSSIVKNVPTTDFLPETISRSEVTYALDLSYFIAEACFDYFGRMAVISKTKDDFISLCRNELKSGSTLLGVIQEFQDGYAANTAIDWFYRDPFFCSIVENIFRASSIDTMLPCQFLIHDIKKQLDEHKFTSSVVVYSSGVMPTETLTKMDEFIGKVIAFKSFLLANLDRDKALSCTSNSGSSDRCKRILFIIEANPNIENVKSFAKIDSFTNRVSPGSVLFMIGSLFKIIEIKHEENNIINVKVLLCGNDSENSTKTLFDRLKAQYIDSNGETDLIGFGQFLITIGNSMDGKPLCDEGERLIRSYVDQLPADDASRPRGYDALGAIHLSRRDFGESLNWFKKSLEFEKEKLPPNDLRLAESYQNIALVHVQIKEFTQALEYFKQTLVIWKASYGDDHPILLPCLTNVASIYEQEEKIEEATACYHQMLAITIKHPLTDPCWFAAVYNNLGNMHYRLESYHLALGFFKTSLEFKLRFLSNDRPSIARTYTNIGLVCESMSNIQESRENFEKAANIYNALYAADHECVKKISELIQNLPTQSA